jgi:hypothetical protein
LLEVSHPVVHRRQEKLFLAGEVAVNRPLADARSVGDLLDVRRRETVFRENRRGSVEDFRSTAFLEIGIRRATHRAGTF